MDGVIGPIIAAKLLLSTEAYELVGEGVEWTAFLILFVSWSMTVAIFLTSAISLVTAFVVSVVLAVKSF